MVRKSRQERELLSVWFYLAHLGIVGTPYAACRTIMGKSAVESARAFNLALGRSVAADGYLVPANAQNSGTLGDSSDMSDGHMVPMRRKAGRRAFLDGNFARRKLPLKTNEYCIWDTELAGFGLRVRPTGNYFWFVRLRHRGKHRRITLGKTDDLNAVLARAQARRLLAEAALDGLPKRVVVKSTPTMNDFVATHFDDLARVWKPSTSKRNANAWRIDLAEHFGEVLVADVSKAEVVRWRDACAGGEGSALQSRGPGSGSIAQICRGAADAPQGIKPVSRNAALQAAGDGALSDPRANMHVLVQSCAPARNEAPEQVAIIRVLLYTGARRSEIEKLRWDWVKPPCLVLPDSKTGPKFIMAQQSGAHGARRD